MKALLISDLHSNIEALESVLQAERDCDQIYCAGDLVDIGPCPNEVVELIRDSKGQCVYGNHDQEVLKYRHSLTTDEGTPTKGLLWYQHNAKALSEENAEFLQELPETRVFELDGITYGMIHLYRGYEVIQSDFEFDKFIADKFAGNDDIQRLLFGHTHRQNITRVSENKMWINPGSIGYRSYQEPENRSKMAEYMTITDGRIEFKKCVYDYEKAARHILDCRHEVLEKDIRRSHARLCDEEPAF